jgi:transcriptional regulator with XRE-family HTH domain
MSALINNKAVNSVGNNIRTLRHQRGWSQEDIATRLGISIPAFSKIETGVTDVNLRDKRGAIDWPWFNRNRKAVFEHELGPKETYRTRDRNC